jgi:xanthine dehydrogenase YagR molybdenum-binding subunit
VANTIDALEQDARPSSTPDAEFDWPANPSVLGTRVKRLDGPEKVTGRAKYTFDIARPRMLCARVVRSPHPHARVVSVDLSVANRMPGVKTTLVWRDPATQNNRVMFQGDEVAAVAADTEEHAIDAARAIKVEYDVQPHVTVEERALAGTAPAVFTGGNVRQGQPQQSGDLAAGFQAAHVIEETYATQVITHTCMETHGTVCEWEGDKLTAWISTQGIAGARENFAGALGIPQANVRVICQYMGGGFGSKALSVGAEGLICARLAKAANAPGQALA